MHNELNALAASAQAERPGFAIPTDAFVEYIAQRLPDTSAPTLARLHVADLYLACGCSRALAEAIACFDREVVAEVPRFVATVDRSAPFVSEVQQRLRERLLVGPAPRIGLYDGSAALQTWARVVALRLAFDLKRPGRERLDSGGELDAVALETDAYGELVRMRHLDDFQQALDEALTELTPRARNLLRLYYVERLGIDGLARIYHTHRATCARWLTDARTQLLERVKQRVCARHDLGESGFRSLAGLLMSGLHVSVGKL